MVRRIRECATCQKRFIANVAKDFHCSRQCSSTATSRDANSSSSSSSDAAAAPAVHPAANTRKNVTTSTTNGKDTTAASNSNSSSTGEKAGLPEFDFYDDDDDDDDDEPLVNLLKPPPLAAAGHGGSQDAFAASQDCIDVLLSNDDDDGDDDEQHPGSENEEEEEDCIDLLSDDDDHQAMENTTGHDDDEAAASSLKFLQEQQQLHATASGGVVMAATAALPPNEQSSLTTTTATTTDQHLSICFVCGSSLTHIQSGYKGRLNHIKRCSKQHGVTAKDVRFNDDHELFADDDCKSSSSSSAPSSSGLSSSSKVNKNPYLQKKNQWHGNDASATFINQKPTDVGAIKAHQAPSVNQMLMAGARRVAKTKQILQQKASSASSVAGGGKKKRRRYNNSTYGSLSSSSSSCPSYKKISGTDFVCDGFQYASPALTKNYFLTHFHADHYGGITKTWNAGTIYCSLPTATLVHQQLGVDRQYLHPLPMLTPTVIESNNNNNSSGKKPVTVTLLDANHCPGAVMFLFQVDRRVILHVGDFRWSSSIMSQQAPLRPFCRVPWWPNHNGNNNNTNRRIDDLYLDTTYCDAKYALPTQEECIKAAVQVAVDEVERAQVAKCRLLMLFGAYTIGKEIVYMSVAKQLGMKVYVDNRRYRILSALEWPPEKMSLLTTRPEDTILWVVPLGHINMKKMASYQSVRMRGFSRDFDRVVGFRPTGWSMSASKKSNSSSVVGTTSRGNLTVHSVPYSEHSSFPELVECLEVLNPKRIIPTVSVSKSQQQIDLLLKHWRDKQAKLL